ncbi:alpha/beta hydrolase [Planctomycetes bacterium K23_9]|uniref:Alpha/beta hydrolase family protein n=1 Tax=Stieleria marina TaxID=1930275 RepID=A0A517NN50_9BACT|nr:Alpha/beta hydrolase family protein [Planctomycetes bacterium K23_9]
MINKQTPPTNTTDRSATRIAKFLLAIGIIGLFVTVTGVAEESLRLKNGLMIQGNVFELPSMKEGFAAAGGGIKSQPIVMVDDGLRRVYLYRRGMVLGEPQQIRGIEETIEFDFDAPLNGKPISVLDSLLGVSPFNEFARRVVKIRGLKGETLSILQGITELNTRYAKVEALKDRPSYIWDQRVATSSIDSDTLQAIFARRLRLPNLDSGDQIDLHYEHARFFGEAKRFNDARKVLQQVQKDFPNEPDIEKRLIAVTEAEASEIIREAQQRAEVGQESFARKIYSGFRPDNVGRITRLEVQDAIAKLDKTQASIDDVMAKLRDKSKQLNAKQIAAINPLLDEMQTGLSAFTLPRLSAFLLADKTGLPVDNHVAMGISGWLLGSGQGVQNLSVAISMITVRNLVAEYLASDDPGRRKAILSELANLEGAEPDYVARMLPLLVPSRKLPNEAEHETIKGMFTVGRDLPSATVDVSPRYIVQLPPDYDPLREYPCIVALHPPQGTPEQQLDWWAGPWNQQLNFRGGHATRHGYIVVAPAWTEPGQGVYNYTPREHQRVLVALRDAMRRTSINADRIFIVGHGDGATAAWDIAVSHPDLWAGLIAISSDPGKTITHYYPNAQQVPIYIVQGFLDRIRSKNNHAFSGILEDYLNVRADAMVVMYRGWGFAFFFDEIHHLFDWMNAASHRRKDIPQKIDHVTMRHGDEFFWWLELDGLKDGTAVDPILWNQAKRIRGKKVEATIGADNQIRISQGPSERFIVWMRPDMGIDLNQRVTIRYGSRRTDHDYDRNLETMLEDVRQRADRKRPFWTKKVVP